MRSSIAIALSAAAIVSAQGTDAVPSDPTATELGQASSQVATLPAGQQSSAYTSLSSYVSLLQTNIYFRARQQPPSRGQMPLLCVGFWLIVRAYRPMPSPPSPA